MKKIRYLYIYWLHNSLNILILFWLIFYLFMIFFFNYEIFMEEKIKIVTHPKSIDVTKLKIPEHWLYAEGKIIDINNKLNKDSLILRMSKCMHVQVWFSEDDGDTLTIFGEGFFKKESEIVIRNVKLSNLVVSPNWRLTTDKFELMPVHMPKHIRHSMCFVCKENPDQLLWFSITHNIPLEYCKGVVQLEDHNYKSRPLFWK